MTLDVSFSVTSSKRHSSHFRRFLFEYRIRMSCHMFCKNVRCALKFATFRIHKGGRTVSPNFSCSVLALLFLDL